MRMDPLKILLLISIIIASASEGAGVETRTCQVKVKPLANKPQFEWDYGPKVIGPGGVLGPLQATGWDATARYWAWMRVTRFLEMLQKWEEVKRPSWILQGTLHI